MKLTLALAAFGAASVTTGLVAAQPPDTSYTAPNYSTPREEPVGTKALPAPSNALEITAATGYTQGFGSLKGGLGMPSVATAGLGLDLGVGYRADPHWAVLWAGQYQEFTAERTAAARGFSTSLAAQYHFVPSRPVDPWIEGGAGYRFLWENPSLGPTILSHGIQLGRVRGGVDFRADKNVAFGPMVGADATMFLFQDAPNLGTAIDEPRLSTFVYAGVQGRFDVGGNETPTRTVSKR